MDFTKINPDIVREFLKLSEARESLMQEVAAIDSQIAGLSSGKLPRGRKPAATTPAAKPTGKKRGRKPGSKNAPKAAAKAPAAPAASSAPPKAKRGRKPGSGKRGAMKEQITGLLSQAGPEGMAVKDISEKLGVKNQNVHVWFSTTGKKVDGISKVGEARYAMAPEAAAPAPAATPAPEAVAA